MKAKRILLLAVLLFTLAAAVVRAPAEEAKMNALQTALSSTTISGYVDTSVEWTLDRSFSIQTDPTQPATKANWWRTLRVWLRVRFGLPV